LAEPRAFYMLARMRARSPCLYARDARRCPVQRRGMAASEQTYRLYNCGRCAEQVRICRRCDRGNQYCAGMCAALRRRESLRRAARRYQGTYRGAYAHAARQRGWRERQTQEVTHHGSISSAVSVTVASTSTQTTIEQGTHVDTASVEPRTRAHSSCEFAITLELGDPRIHARGAAHRAAVRRLRCSVCGGVLPPFARLGPLRGGP
jgi:hypothetical protein